jgi:hypothetical protein
VRTRRAGVETDEEDGAWYSPWIGIWLLDVGRDERCRVSVASHRESTSFSLVQGARKLPRLKSFLQLIPLTTTTATRTATMETGEQSVRRRNAAEKHETDGGDTTTAGVEAPDKSGAAGECRNPPLLRLPSAY